MFYFLFALFRIAWLPSAEKELSSWLSSCAVLLYSALIVCASFQFGVWGRMWNLIVTVPDLAVGFTSQTLDIYGIRHSTVVKFLCFVIDLQNR